MEVQDCKIRFANGEAADICGRLLLAKSVEELCIRKFAEYLEVERFKLADNTGKSVELMLAVDGVYAYWNGVNDWTAVQGERPFEAHMSDEFMSFWIDSVTADPELRSNVSFNVDDEMDIEFGWNALADRIQKLLFKKFSGFKESCIGVEGQFPAVVLEWRTFDLGSVEELPFSTKGVFAKLLDDGGKEKAEGWLGFTQVTSPTTVMFDLIQTAKSEDMFRVYFEMADDEKPWKYPRWENLLMSLTDFVVETLNIQKSGKEKFSKGFTRGRERNHSRSISRTFGSKELWLTLTAKIRENSLVPVLQAVYGDGKENIPFYVNPSPESCDLPASETENNSVLKIEGWLSVDYQRYASYYARLPTSRVAVIVTFNSDMDCVSLKFTAAPTKITKSLDDFLSTFNEVEGFIKKFVVAKHTVEFFAPVGVSPPSKVYVLCREDGELKAVLWLDSNSSWKALEDDTDGNHVVQFEGGRVVPFWYESSDTQLEGRTIVEMTFEKSSSPTESERC
eukprot:GHVS01067380.1.p1 GENE.GHVS01067380.1~~GHVS01067380.1.p1  ORF type:complete len:521 (+),score=59.95 GHVS01067380.1:45-1565(+)